MWVSVVTFWVKASDVTADFILFSILSLSKKKATVASWNKNKRLWSNLLDSGTENFSVRSSSDSRKFVQFCQDLAPWFILDLYFSSVIVIFIIFVVCLCVVSLIYYVILKLWKARFLLQPITESGSTKLPPISLYIFIAYLQYIWVFTQALLKQYTYSSICIIPRLSQLFLWQLYFYCVVLQVQMLL